MSALLLVAMVLTACGSTVPMTDGGLIADGHGVADGLGPPDDGTASRTEDPADGAPLPSQAQPAPGGTGPAASGPGDTPGTTGPPTTDPTDAPGPTGVRPVAPGTRGIDDQRIVLGLEIVDGADEANRSLGAAVGAGDGRANYDALLAWANATGGIGGRQVEAVYHSYNALSTQTFGTQEQAACATFTQDHEVFVVGTLLRHSDTMLSCLESAGVPLVSGATSNTDNQTFRQFPNYVELGTLSLDEIGRQLPRALADAGYFVPRSVTEQVSVGIFSYDAPRYRRAVQDALMPALAAIGHASVREIYGTEFQSLNDASRLSTDAASATVRFRSDGVTHVLLFDNGSGGATLFFTQAAESQGWYPRYGLSSNNGGQTIIDAGAPPAQFRDSVLMGWLQTFDVPPSEQDPPNATARQCEEIFAAAGIAFPGANERVVGMGQCETILFLRAVIDGSDGPLDHGSVRAGADRLGTTFESPTFGPTRYGPDRRYGVSRYRPAAFDESCTCFRYTAGWQPL